MKVSAFRCSVLERAFYLQYVLPLPNEAPLLLGWIVTYVASVSELLAILVCNSFMFCMTTNC
jgi:hypothetical protein